MKDKNIRDSLILQLDRRVKDLIVDTSFGLELLSACSAEIDSACERTSILSNFTEMNFDTDAFGGSLSVSIDWASNKVTLMITVGRAEVTVVGVAGSESTLSNWPVSAFKNAMAHFPEGLGIHV